MDNSLHEYVMQSAQSAAKKTGSAVKSATQTGLPDWDSSSRKYELQTRRKRMMAGGVLVAIFGLFYVGRFVRVGGLVGGRGCGVVAAVAGLMDASNMRSPLPPSPPLPPPSPPPPPPPPSLVPPAGTLTTYGTRRTTL